MPGPVTVYQLQDFKGFLDVVLETVIGAACTAETELQVEQVVLRIHADPEPPHSATADFDQMSL